MSAVSVDDSIKIINSKNINMDSEEFFKLKEGDAFPNIVLYDTCRQIVPLDSIFKDSKGVIFVTGSYTCPNFRSNVKPLNQMVSNQINTYRVYFVYILEAHPLSDSPYGKLNNNTNPQGRAGISIEQEKWLEERVFYAKKANKDLKITSNILIDNEKNEFFWKIFSGPNGIMIFSPDRKMVRQDLWYNQPKKKPKKDRKN